MCNILPLVEGLGKCSRSTLIDWSKKKVCLYFQDRFIRMNQIFLQYFDNMKHNLATPNPLLRLWRWQRTLNCEMRCSPDTLQVLLTRLAWIIALEYMVLHPPDLAFLLRFLQPKQNFLNPQVAVLWSTAFSPYVQEIFLVASAVLWSSSNS